MKIEIMNKIEEQIRDNGPSILTGLGVVGLVSTVGLAIKATMDFDKDTETKEHKFKSIVKHYWPVAVIGAGSIACIVGSNKMNMKRNLALAGALKLSESKITEYKDKWLGTSKEHNEESLKKNTIIFGDSDIDCYDPITGRYFKSNISDIREGIDYINRMIYGDDQPCYNDFYGFLNVEPIENGLDMKWDIDSPVDLVLDSKLTEKSKPILVIDFSIRPKYDETF